MSVIVMVGIAGAWHNRPAHGSRAAGAPGEGT
jgi:hypothetical protein